MSAAEPFPVPDDVRAALFDIDGTLTSGGEAWSELLNAPEVGRGRKLWLYARALPPYALTRINALDQAVFRDRWVRLMAGLMAGWTAARVKQLCEQIVERSLVPALRPDVVRLLEAHKDRGHVVVLVSTMFEGVVDGLARRLGADRGLGSVLAFTDGSRCAGRIDGPTCSGARKLDFARAYLEMALPGTALSACAAYADSASDIPFLSGVGRPAAVYPDEPMRAVARAKGWPVFEAG